MCSRKYCHFSCISLRVPFSFIFLTYGLSNASSDAFLGKEELKDIEKYRQSPVKQSVLLDYSRDEVVDMQVLKQADLVMLFTLFPGLFPADVVKKNVLFYEKRTLHDSSLSYCASNTSPGTRPSTRASWTGTATRHSRED